MSEVKIKVEKADEARIEEMGIRNWPVWTKEPSTFEWHYDEPEACYFLDGDVTVKTEAGNVRIGKGDFVKFPKGLRCTWEVRKAVRKHYSFG